ncbi:MAG: sigma 54-interacting transcriptional regulator [Atribacterota bacterium]|nr:sigma 54-interacting transcriptional regulator [Atribacterota bacterium]
MQKTSNFLFSEDKDLKFSRHIFTILNSILEYSFSGLWITNGEGKVLGISRASEKISEIRSSEVIGKNILTLQGEGFFNKSIALEVLRKKTTVMRTQKIKSGKIILTKGQPVLDNKGNIKLIILNDWDVTYLNNLREKLKESQALTKGYRSELSRIWIKDLEENNVVFKSKISKRVIESALMTSKVDASVLLLGESGVGKSLIAKLIHKYSPRANQPFICVNCGAIPESLMESELFGYEEGSFTGASKRGKVGIFELADRGTIFLDEIDALLFQLQVKLLHVLEDMEIIRVGGTKHKKVDVRIIAASNQNIEKLVEQKNFRQDLFYRLNVVSIFIPPLRERQEDIPPLINFFLYKFNEKYKKKKIITPQLTNFLSSYHFPGNIRELSNIVERAVVMTKKENIELEDIFQLGLKLDKNFPIILEEKELSLGEAVGNLEHFMIERAIKKYKNQIKVAEVLKINQSTISRKLKKYGIKNNDML